MSEGKLDIKLRIAGKTYSMTINREEEEVCRLAEREVNRYVAQLENMRLDGYAAQDFLAIVAWQLARAGIRMKQSHNLDSEDMKQLSALASELDKYLNK